MAIMDAIPKQSKIEEFVLTFEAFNTESKKNEPDKARCLRLSSRVDMLYNGLSEDGKLQALKLLVEKGLAPQSWLDVCTIFNGTIKKFSIRP